MPKKLAALEFLKAFAKLTKDSPQQHKFYMWQLDIAKEVKPIRIKDDPEIEEMVNKFLKHNKVKMKECYYNSFKFCSSFPQTYYVEGFVSFKGIPIEHSWLFYKGKYFDLTAEFVQKELHEEYVATLVIPSKEMFKLAVKTELSGPYIGVYYGQKENL